MLFVRPVSQDCLGDEACAEMAASAKRGLRTPEGAPRKSAQLLRLPLAFAGSSPPESPRNSQAGSSGTPSSSSSSPRKKLTKDNFNLIKLLGTGAYSRVALVEEIGTGKKLAMKVMEKAFLRKVQGD